MRASRLVSVVLSAMLLVSLLACGNGSKAQGGNRGGGGGAPFTTFLVASDPIADNVPILGINGGTGSLSPVSGSPVAAGATPIAVAVAPNGSFVYVANQGSSNVSAFTMATNTGILTSIGSVAAGTQPNSIAVDPSGKFVAVNDQASQDISLFSINPTSAVLTPLSRTPTLLVPTAVIFSGQFMYVQFVNAIAGFRLDNASGVLTQMAGSPFIFNNQFNNLHALAVSPNGRFLYAADSGQNLVYSFSLDSATGIPTQIGIGLAAGTHPVAMAFEPSGNHLYVADDVGNTITVLNANPTNGFLTPNTSTIVTAPVALTFDTANNFLIAATNANQITVYTLNATTGVLTPAIGSPTTVGSGPNSLAVARP